MSETEIALAIDVGPILKKGLLTDDLIGRLGDMAGYAFIHKLREMACEEYGHSTETIVVPGIGIECKRCYAILSEEAA